MRRRVLGVCTKSTSFTRMALPAMLATKSATDVAVWICREIYYIGEYIDVQLVKEGLIVFSVLLEEM